MAEDFDFCRLYEETYEILDQQRQKGANDDWLLLTLWNLNKQLYRISLSLEDLGFGITRLEDVLKELRRKE